MASNLVDISWRSKVVDKMGGCEEGESEVVSWEEYLPTTAIRVLLVESDDSTRQVIAALLRKCNFKVAAISDGLEAWEILKQRHCNFDLILTEVDLPSISGYALLTLIMEHDYCNNIPVIMMSSSYSISMAFECLLKGAADFLIKPLRRNELKNLWQHVWRRISHANDGPTAQNLPVSHFEARCSDDNVPSTEQKGQSDEKASDTQSSCATDHLEAENESLERMQGLSHVKHREPCKLNQDEQRGKRMRLEEEAKEDNLACGDEETRQAIDLISTIDNHHKLTLEQSISNYEMQNSTVNPQLQLSLSNPDERKPDVQQKLNHSTASAFSNYGSSINLLGFFHSTGFSSTLDKEGVKINEKAQQPVNGFSQNESSPLLTSPSLVHSGFDETSNSTLCSSGFTAIQARVSMEDDIEDEHLRDKGCNMLMNEQFEERAKGIRNFQREAALAKFRQKRKDRCYEKRVRYQSRKKLA